ncbi:PTS sugar transporter subunit IIA [Brachybacterium nesterenkovii]|uniref:Ascorbate-specific PTS system EIIA component n=1 Tax=Brachybacterium nesterenkovii TaxID=47847 RepID=A0A1X6X7G2_9MICO|nr:PTS sugar transporter subunit IIA [Brachybacterium nesterenkovii]SLM95264.1 Putative phosphotransferase system protein [Brachybacterium nesterenkovii]
MSQLSDLVDPSAIRLDVPADDWRSAIRASGELLTGVGVASDAYTDSMVRTVEEHGPYIVIAPGFALAHARPDESVARTGLSFVRLAEPVAFGNADNDPVTIVMALAAADSSAHQQALASLAGVLSDPDRRRALDIAATPDEVLYALGAGDDEAPRGRRAAQADDAAHADDAAAAGTADAAAGAAAAGTAGAGAGAAAAGTAGAGAGAAAAGTADAAGAVAASAAAVPENEDTVPSKNFILTVCGNGVGTSLFLKNTAEKVLERWGWTRFVSIEATDTISAKGRAKEADVVLTSGAIADALGDVGVPVEIIRDFTSQAEIDAALRRTYAV